MRIALLSPFLSQNHGTVLQAFALAKVISDLGYDCEYLKWNLFDLSFWGKVKFLCRHPKYIHLSRECSARNSKDLDYSFLQTPEFKTIIEKNKTFVESYTPVAKHTIVVDALNDLPYDKFIVGSDQTWSPNLLYQYSPYFLEQVKKNDKKFSYACSMGKTNIPDKFKSFIARRLKSFSLLSCREEPNCKMIENLIGKHVENVLDPTLLLNKEQWGPYMKSVDMPSKYIVCYILGEKKCIGEYADELGRNKGLPVYYIMTRPSSCNHKNVLKGVGCQEFLWLIANCEYLVTDSFHGTIFALNFERNVMAFDKHEGDMYDNGRILDVLSAYHQESHYMNSSSYREPSPIDFTQVNFILREKRKTSMAFLNKILVF